jgi:hypothetical protein
MVKIGSRATFSSRIAGNRFFGDHANSVQPTVPIEGSLERSRHYGHFDRVGQTISKEATSNTNSRINMK